MAICQGASENLASVQLHELLIRLQSVIGYLKYNVMADLVSLPSSLRLAINALKEVLCGRLLNGMMQATELDINRLSCDLSESNLRDC